MNSQKSAKDRWWRTLSIRHKIQYSIIGFAFVVLVLTAIILSQSALSHFHTSSERELTVLTQVLADNSRAALTFDDADAAVAILSAVSKNPDIVSAVMFKDDQVFAAFPADVQLPETGELVFEPSVSFKHGSYFAVAPIKVNDKTLGWLRLQSQFDTWQLVWKRLIATFAGLLGAVLLLTFFMSYWLKKHITLPLRALSQWATNVYQNKSFNERAHKHSDDEIGLLADSLNAMLTELSKQESIVSLNHDLEAEIAVRKKTAQELLAMRDKAEQANRSKSDFLANMSHEIRTPMNAIIGFVDILLEGDLDEKQCEHLRTVRDSAKDLHNLLNDILDIAKLEEGKLELEQMPFSVKELVKHVAKTFELKAQEKGIQIIQRISANFPDNFLGDSLRLKQILMNLLGNAIKFTDSGYITIAVEQLDPERLQFIVRDTGIGIPKDKLAHIFESFSQADSSTSRKYGGTGLGTTISKRLVELMGGKIWLESDEGVGSTFYFTIKLKQTEQVAEIEHLAIDTSLLKTEQPLKVLVAEDGEQNAELLKIRLEALGHEFIRAVDGLQAVKLCSENSYDIILMDVQMPVMDGLQASEKIRQLPKYRETPIVALTASVMHEDRKACFASGMDGFVKKPIVFNELFTEMAKLLQHRFRLAENQPARESSKPAPLDTPYINFQQGVTTWASAEVYTKNLKQFADLHRDDMKLLRRYIENEEFDNASKLIHSLKGTAGNLALADLYDELLIMNGYLKRHDQHAATEHITILTNTFMASINAIHELDETDNSAEDSAEVDLPELIARINRQVSALANGEFDEAEIRVLQQQLALLSLSDSMLRGLRSAIDNFEFDQAVHLLSELLAVVENQEPPNAAG